MPEELRLNIGPVFDGIYNILEGRPVFKMFIGGKWRPSESGETFDVRTPIDGSVVARAQLGGRTEVDLAATAAEEGRGIRGIPAIERIEIFNCAAALMTERSEDLARVLQIEAGKTVKDAEGEVAATIHRMKLAMEDARKIFGEYIPGDWSADSVGKMALVIREPVGVIAAISPFNYPLYIATSKVMPALLAGNSVILKPSSSNPISAALLARILEMSGLPSGGLNLVTGSGEETGDAITAHPKVDMINFTGSTPVGRRISERAAMKRLHLELGGKGYAIVLDDADLALAAEKIVAGSMKFAGQRCDAVSAVLAVPEIADDLSGMIVANVDRLKFGDPRDPSVQVGPVISQRAAERIHGMVTDAADHGGEILRGGKYHGTYYEPTVIDNVPIYAVIAHEETFGPVIPIIRVGGEDEALRVATSSRYGLESCVFTRDFYRMWRVAKALRVGEVTINDFPSHGVGYFPFGGIKESGMGREGVGYSIDEMTVMKTIVFNLAAGGLGKKDVSAATCRIGITIPRHSPADGE